MFRKKQLLLAFGFITLLLTTGCSSTWVVSKDLEGGVIGYRGFDDSSEALMEISKKIDCEFGYVGVEDSLRSAPYQYTSYEKISGTGRHVSYGRRGVSTKYDSYDMWVPVTRTGTSNWREYRYQCRKSPVVHPTERNVSLRPLAD